MSLLSIIIIGVFLIFLITAISFGVYHFTRDIAQGLGGYGIPYIHTPEEKIAVLLKNLHLKNNDIFIDIGCGNGAILEAVKMQFPHTKVIGYEKSNRPYKDALKRRKKNGLNYEIYNEDFLSANIENATVLYSYMINYMMEKIWEKVNRECKPGTQLFSSSFPIRSTDPKDILELSQGGKIFIYEIGYTRGNSIG